MSLVGYAHLRSLAPHAPDVSRRARVGAATRIATVSAETLVPRAVAPGDALLEHVLFALKHEGTNLQVLADVMPLIEAGELRAALREAPNGAYIRTACFLWESFTARHLDDVPAVGGAVAHVFDPSRYVTGPARKSAKWRVSFNGLGSLKYCATVERTPRLAAALDRDVLAQVRHFAESIPEALADRALEWAYLHETQSSFAIERESPSDTRARRFVQLLRQAHDGAPLSEDYVVQLQQEAIANPHDRAASYRIEQNWLSDGRRGAAGITYIPPPPELARELTQELFGFINSGAAATNPLVMAAVGSFGFVYLHPFMDGNGRLSRFLFHKTLCLSGQLPSGLLLPVSVAMKKNETAYLRTLETFSKPTRQFWDARWIDEGVFQFAFKGSASMYRYWDATQCVEFSLDMAQQALDVELKQEADFLSRYDRVVRQLGERFDVRGSTLSSLVVMCLDNGGVVSKNRRRQFEGEVPAALFDAMERCATEALAAPQAQLPSGSTAAPGPRPA